MRSDGIPCASAVASAMAVGSVGSLRDASSNHALKCAIGSLCRLIVIGFVAYRSGFFKGFQWPAGRAIKSPRCRIDMLGEF
jgi:hypothetical protein